MKTPTTEKTEYTIVLPVENPTKLSTQIFDFWNFVTQIFFSFSCFEIGKYTKFERKSLKITLENLSKMKT